MTTYNHHRCATCRFAWSTAQTHEAPAEGGCMRERDLDTLVELSHRKGDEELASDAETWGSESDCPIWESRSMGVCPDHGIYDAEGGCERCAFGEAEDDIDAPPLTDAQVHGLAHLLEE